MSAPTLPLDSAVIATQDHSGFAVVFEDVWLAFEENEVLRGVSFRLPLGETKALFGVAGAGKSTILKLVLGLLKPDAGRITVLGAGVAEMREQDLFALRGKIGMVFQESALFDSLTVRENVAFRLMEEHGIYSEDIDRRVREALSFVELEHTVDMLPSELSGGMRRRVAIARAIITQPELLLYDSPTGGLDPVTSNTIVELIVKQRDVYKTSSLLVSHRLQDAFTMATHEFDRQSSQLRALPRGQYCNVPMSFLVLRDGKVIFDGDIHELAQTKDDYIREYIS
ncbi:MAG: ATP-binding cassette domain-containing protein [Acidobacteriia bacterium]|nr:ATP-binding cassette domain-containing protein [Terriglobia bacterium]MBZ5706959.1 ATP-binding cassette domain-containing protein [Terriglobia bacterium]